MAVTRDIAQRQAAKSGIKVTPAVGDDPAPAEIIEKAIIDVAAGMAAINNTRLKHETIVTLLHANSGVSKANIRIILNNLAELETIFLKPAPPRK